MPWPVAVAHTIPGSYQGPACHGADHVKSPSKLSCAAVGSWLVTGHCDKVAVITRAVRRVVCQDAFFGRQTAPPALVVVHWHMVRPNCLLCVGKETIMFITHACRYSRMCISIRRHCSFTAVGLGCNDRSRPASAACEPTSSRLLHQGLAMDASSAAAASIFSV